ncbi:hypothetical protein MKW98_004737, partial [Papaver atlanticum]
SKTSRRNCLKRHELKVTSDYIRLTIESCLHENSTHVKSFVATLDLVDLAGSERAAQTKTDGTRLKEGSHINRSLLTLMIVIRKISTGGRLGHVPYRDSKLTRILQPSVEGNCRTASICTMSPALSHMEQSQNTLSFASSVKEVKNTARVNMVRANPPGAMSSLVHMCLNYQGNMKDSFDVHRGRLLQMHLLKFNLLTH